MIRWRESCSYGTNTSCKTTSSTYLEGHQVGGDEVTVAAHDAASASDSQLQVTVVVFLLAHRLRRLDFLLRCHYTYGAEHIQDCTGTHEHQWSPCGCVTFHSHRFSCLHQCMRVERRWLHTTCGKTIAVIFGMEGNYWIIMYSCATNDSNAIVHDALVQSSMPLQILHNSCGGRRIIYSPGGAPLTLCTPVMYSSSVRLKPSPKNDVATRAACFATAAAVTNDSVGPDVDV